MSKKQKELVEELLVCRKHIFNMLADLAEEEGRIYDARAWKWMRDHNKWPSERKMPKNAYAMKKEYGYGWSFSTDARGLKDSENRRSSNLPYCLIDGGFMESSPCEFEKTALMVAMRAISKYFAMQEQNEKWLQENTTK